jgi:hypothetical protein
MVRVAKTGRWDFLTRHRLVPLETQRVLADAFRQARGYFDGISVHNRVATWRLA